MPWAQSLSKIHRWPKNPNQNQTPAKLQEGRPLTHICMRTTFWPCTVPMRISGQGGEDPFISSVEPPRVRNISVFLSHHIVSQCGLLSYKLHQNICGWRKDLCICVQMCVCKYVYLRCVSVLCMFCLWNMLMVVCRCVCISIIFVCCGMSVHMCRNAYIGICICAYQ